MASTSTAKRLSAPEKYPNWLELPHELMANILERLGDAEILNSALKVCTTWWKICKDPAMWKVINMRKPVDDRDGNYDIVALTKQAVHLSCGELIDISLEGFGTNDLLDHILLRSSKLKSLSLTDCCNLTTNRLNHALKMVPQLEKLHISYTSAMDIYYEVRVPNCPQIKSFKLDNVRMYINITSDIDALAIAKNMPELRHLQLYGNAITNTGLKAILDGCTHLESLDIRTCYNINIHGNEGKLCMERIKNFKGPNDSTENCGFHPRILEYEESDDSQDNYYDEYDPNFDDDPSNYMDMDDFMDYYTL